MRSYRNYLLIVFFLCFSLGNDLNGIEPLEWACADYPNAYYMDKNGEIRGFLYDIAIEALTRRMGIEVNITFYPWKRCQLLVETGEADMLLTVPTDIRLEYTVASRIPLWEKKRVIYTYKGNSRIEEINKIRRLEDILLGDFTVISYLGNGWAETKVEKMGIEVVYSPSIKNIYKMLVFKRGDIIIEEKSLVEAELKKDIQLNENIIKTSGIGSTVGFFILIRENSEYVEIIDELDIIISEMWNDGTIVRILSKYGL